MTINEQDADNLKRCCLGNMEAVEFLSLWSDYVNLVDDICDEDLVWTAVDGARGATRPTSKRMAGAARVCAMGALAIQVYSHPFYLKNLAALRQIAFNCTNAYLDSVLWEGSAEEWQREWSDHYRHFGAEMVIAVAGICGGWQQVRNVSLVLRQICWNSHHTAAGKPE